MKAIFKTNNFRTRLKIILNKLCVIEVNKIKIPRGNSGVILAHEKLKYLPIDYDIDGNNIILKYKEYNLVTSALDESFIMTIEESFLNDEYQLEELDLTDKVVLDIGANIGDTAIKFINNGAKKVYALEPMLRPYNYLKMNVKNNNLIDKIVTFNYGIGNTTGVLKIPIRKNASGGNSIYYRKENSLKKVYDIYEEVKVINIDNLSSIITDKIDILKIDCEGCEYNIFSDYETIRKINPELILVEYHSGSEQILNYFKNYGGYDIEVIYEKNNKLGLLKFIRIND
jgi:FkbM family methyltransferase